MESAVPINFFFVNIDPLIVERCTKKGVWKGTVLARVLRRSSAPVKLWYQFLVAVRRKRPAVKKKAKQKKKTRINAKETTNPILHIIRQRGSRRKTSCRLPDGRSIGHEGGAADVLCAPWLVARTFV